MAAPSACNIQPWDFIILTEKNILDKIKNATGDNKNYNPDTIIVICGNNKHIPWKDHGIIDCAAAMENILITAPTIGLGTVVIGGFEKDKIKEFLEIPEEIEPVCLIYLGYPKEEKNPRTKYLDEAVHWEKFDNKRKQDPRPGNIIVFGPDGSL